MLTFLMSRCENGRKRVNNITNAYDKEGFTGLGAWQSVSYKNERKGYRCKCRLNLHLIIQHTKSFQMHTHKHIHMLKQHTHICRQTTYCQFPHTKLVHHFESLWNFIATYVQRSDIWYLVASKKRHLVSFTGKIIQCKNKNIEEFTSWE